MVNQSYNLFIPRVCSFVHIQDDIYSMIITRSYSQQIIGMLAENNNLHERNNLSNIANFEKKV
jgi:hypothetical protein